jgi:hypothetical protein
LTIQRITASIQGDTAQKIGRLRQRTLILVTSDELENKLNKREEEAALWERFLQGDGSGSMPPAPLAPEDAVSV